MYIYSDIYDMTIKGELFMGGCGRREKKGW
jgi:hypothetical protein